MKKKLLYSISAAAIAVLVWMGATPGGTEIRRGGGGGTAGSITNLSAVMGQIYNSSAKNIDVTNFTRLLTNVFDSSFGTNVDISTSATNGWIRITNDGQYVLDLTVNYKVSVPSAIPRTNVFGIATNANSLGTNLAAFVTTTPNTNTSVFNFASVKHQAFLASNTFISAAMFNTINIGSTNSNSVERVYLSATLLPGSPYGTGSSGTGITDGDKGHITVSNSGATWTIDPGVISGAFSNIVYLDAGPDPVVNGTALTNATKNAAQGTLIIVGPGSRITPELTVPSTMMAVENVSTFWLPGATWGAGTLGATAGFMWDDTAALRTNCNVYGFGRFFSTNASSSVFYFERNSSFYAEGLSAYITNNTINSESILTWDAASAARVVMKFSDYTESATYDNTYGDVTAGFRLYAEINEMRALGDLVEFTGTSPSWDNIYVKANISKQLANPGQSSFFNLAGRTRYSPGTFTVVSKNSSIRAVGNTNAIVENAIIQLPPDGTVPTIFATSGNHAGILFKNTIFYNPTNVNFAVITNTQQTIFEDCTIFTGFASTNWIESGAAATAQILGRVSLIPYKNKSANVTITGTNYVPNAIFANATATRAAVFDANGMLVSASGSPDGTKFLRDDNVYAVPSGTGSGGTNYPPSLLFGTNITVGSGVRQNVTIKTNANFGVNFQGTPLNGETITLTVSNFHETTTIGVTNYQSGTKTAWLDKTVASNVTEFLVAPLSSRTITFEFNTNAVAGTIRQEMMSNLGKEMELAVAGPRLVALTNAAGSILTVSNSLNLASAVVAGAGSGNTNFTLVVSSNSVNTFYLSGATGNGVNIPAVMNTAFGFPVFWTAIVTNHSSGNTGIGFSSATNRWVFKGDGGVTNAPSVLTNHVALMMSGMSDGTNTYVGWTFFNPAF